jgi:hypothetical protein
MVANLKFEVDRVADVIVHENNQIKQLSDVMQVIDR